jgi:hypothetical protein
MKLVMTLLLPDDPGVVDAQLGYHLDAGVDFVIVAGRDSGEATNEILASYEELGLLEVIGEERRADAGERQTHMARLAATEHAADWVINCAAAEFWWPRAASLKDVLAPIPPRYTIVQGLRREFVAERDADELFSERMTMRRSEPDRSSGVRSSLAATLRPIHRADPDVVVHGDGAVTLANTVPLRAWYPIEVLHFPLDDEQTAVETGTEDSLVEDFRLRDALRVLRETAATEGSVGQAFALPSDGGRLSFRTPDIVDDAAYAVECVAVGEVDLRGLEQYIAELEQRVGRLEQRIWPRMLRAASRLAGRSAR